MVDLISTVMILWAITGGAMWWQMRNVRRSGTVVIVISILWSTGLGYFVYYAFKLSG
jgi:CHASE2 domain-containing sensor protein